MLDLSDLWDSHGTSLPSLSSPDDAGSSSSPAFATLHHGTAPLPGSSAASSSAVDNGHRSAPPLNSTLSSHVPGKEEGDHPHDASLPVGNLVDLSGMTETSSVRLSSVSSSSSSLGRSFNQDPTRDCSPLGGGGDVPMRSILRSSDSPRRDEAFPAHRAKEAAVTMATPTAPSHCGLDQPRIET